MRRKGDKRDKRDKRDERDKRNIRDKKKHEEKWRENLENSVLKFSYFTQTDRQTFRQTYQGTYPPIEMRGRI